MSTTTENGQVILTLEEALARLPKKKTQIHTFVQGGPGLSMLIGADWSKQRVLELLTQAERQSDWRKQIQETGDSAQGMGHGIAAYDEEGGYMVFIEASGPTPVDPGTQPPTLDEMEAGK